MAKENLVWLHGQIHTIPKIYANNDGELIKAMYAVKVLHRPLDGGRIRANKLFLNCPIVLTRNQELIKKSTDLNQNDMVDIRGVLSTREVIKSTICPNCGTKNSTNGVSTYVTPIYICKRESNLTKEEGLELLKERCEISNLIMIIGTLCREPEIYINEKNHSFAQYQIAVNRKYRIREDPPEVKTDYPWIKTIGDQALKDAGALHVGSQVYIRGAIQTREIERETVCEHCGETYSWNDSAVEIAPYSTEYLENCSVPKKEGEADFEES